MTRAERMTARWADPLFRGRMATRKRRTNLEIEQARATRQTKRELKATKAAERIAKRETREQRRIERERERNEKRLQRELKQARKLARATAPLPKVQVNQEFIPNWAALRQTRVTVFEGGKLVQRYLYELGEEHDHVI